MSQNKLTTNFSIKVKFEKTTKQKKSKYKRDQKCKN